MQQPFRILSIAGLACLMLNPYPAFARSGAECRQNGLEHLRTSSPDGFAIYRQISQPSFFKNWISCDDAQFDLATAVHESTHFITAETDAFPLVGGGSIQRPHQVSDFFPPFHIASKFKSDDFVATYLRRGRASSSTDFLYLLDELNAYSHDLNAAVDLKDLNDPDEAVDHRDGLAALMAFLAVYAKTAQEDEPATWSALQEPQVAETISSIWERAERVMASSCGIPQYGTEDRTYIRRYCAAPTRSALETVLGRSIVCPSACLTPTPDLAQAGHSGAIVTPVDVSSRQPSEPSRASPSWTDQMIRFLSRRSTPQAGDAPAEEQH